MRLIASLRIARTRRARIGPRWLLAGLLLGLAWLSIPASATADEAWLPIDPADLALRSNPADPAAHAMVLYSETRIDMAKGDSFHYMRIKIFDDAGRKFAKGEAEYGGELYSVIVLLGLNSPDIALIAKALFWLSLAVTVAPRGAHHRAKVVASVHAPKRAAAGAANARRSSV
jgi:hypothetical protein